MKGASDKRSFRVDAVRGTQDLLPEEAARWEAARVRVRGILGLYGFHEIVTPVFESVDLFRRPLGEGSDVVAKEMYEFKDRGGRDLALRPEGTAPVVRAFISHGLYAKKGKHKLFYSGPIFRYDRPQAGRYRQHHQVGVEVFGDPGASQDAEVVAAGIDVLSALGVTGCETRVNTGGCPKCRPAFEERLREYARAKKDALCKDCSGHRLEHNVMRILDCKNAGCAAETADAPDITSSLCGDCAAHFESFLGFLSSMGIGYSRDSRLFRGFDYYTRTVFEMVNPKGGAQGTVLGGGRYDGLVELLGGPPTPAVGFGMGMERALGMSAQPAPSLAPAAFVVFKTEGALKGAMLLCRRMRQEGIACELGSEGKSLNSQMRSAGSSGARYAVIAGPEGEGVGLKDLSSGVQEQVSVDEMIRRLGRRDVGA